MNSISMTRSWSAASSSRRSDLAVQEDRAVVVVRATNMGDGFVLTEEYASLVD